MLTMILIEGAVAIAVGCAAGMISYEIDPDARAGGTA